MNSQDPTRSIEIERLNALRRSGLLDTPGNDRFGKLTAFVQDMLDVPVAIVTLIDEGRQVFLGHSGLPADLAETSQTPIEYALCRNVVDLGTSFRVDDTHANRRTCANLAVTDMGVGAYLGIPLHLPTGEIVGALAALGFSPRAWTDDDVRRLTSIATMVEQEIAGRLSENRWRLLFQQLEEGFVLGRVIRDDTGKVVDWRYEEVNQAWGSLVGFDVDEAVGRTVREVMPDIEETWIEEAAEVVRSGIPVRFTRQVARTGRWYDGFIQSTGPETFAVLFVEVTERVMAEEARLNVERQMRTIIDSVPVGIALAAAPSGDIIMANGRLSEILGHDVATVVNADRRDDGSEFPLSRIVAGGIDHVEAEIHYNRPDGSQVWLGIVGEAVKDMEGNTAGAVVAVTDIGPRKLMEARQTVLNYELAHRLKNTLAVVSSIATQTLRVSPDVATAQRSLSSRILTLSKAHDIILVGDKDAGSVSDIVKSAVDVHDVNGRIRLFGPQIMIGSKAALSLALVMNELATNAGKYGSLSVQEGGVEVTWSLTGKDAMDLVIEWREHGGPTVVPPTRKGFGSRLIQMGLPGGSAGSVEMDYASTGMRCVITSPLADLQNARERRD